MLKSKNISITLMLNELIRRLINDLLWYRNQIFVQLGNGSINRYIPVGQQSISILYIYIHVYKP
jgi:site-specific recombinase XerD